MKRRLASLFLQDILRAMDRIARFVGDRDYETFAADELLTSAVVRQLEIIGEAAKNLPQGIRERYADLPWHLTAFPRLLDGGLRDRVEGDPGGAACPKAAH